MAYADYTYYTGDYCGNAIQEADFPRLALRASDYLDYYTQGKAARHAELPALKKACCALAEEYQTLDHIKALAQKNLAYAMQSDGAEMASESVGSWSRSYRSGGESAASAVSTAKEYEAELANIAKRYLAGTGLLYRGGRCCPCRCFRTL